MSEQVPPQETEVELQAEVQADANPIEQPISKDVEIFEGRESAENFKELSGSARGGFIIKVYLILMTQLCLSAAMVAVSVFSPAFRQFQHRNLWLTILSLVVSLVWYF